MRSNKNSKTIKVLKFLKNYLNCKQRIIEHYYNIEGIFIGYNKLTKDKFYINLLNKKVLYIIQDEILMPKFIYSLINNLLEKNIKIIFIDWYNQINNYKINIDQTKFIFTKLFYFNINSYLNINFLLEIFSEHLNLTIMETEILKNVLHEIIIKSNKRVFTIKEIKEKIEKIIFRGIYENEVKFHLLRKFDTIFENEIINEIQINLNPFKTNLDKFIYIPFTLFKNIKLKFIILEFILKTFIVNSLDENLALILNIPSTIYKAKRDSEKNLFINNLKEIISKNIKLILIIDDIDLYINNLKNETNYFIASKLSFQNFLKEIKKIIPYDNLFEEILYHINTSKKDEIIVIEKNFKIFSLLPSLNEKINIISNAIDEIIFE